MSFQLKLDETISKIRKINQSHPKIGVILGTGLGGLIKEIDIQDIISYEDIPHFPVSTVESHHGNLIFGKIQGKEIVAMQGRMHYYEGYSMQEITYPIYVMKKLGVEILIVSNACGSVNPVIPVQSIMLIEDHINLFGDNPLIGVNDDTLGPRFPDMSEPYSKRLIKLAEDIALEEKIKVHKGVYAAMTGPNLETRAEYRMLRIIGADVIGMSTIPEDIVARYLGLEVFGVSIVTDECYPDALKPVKIEHVLAAAAAAEPKFNRLIVKLIQNI